MSSVRRENVGREYRHGSRGESARRCIGSIAHGCDIFGMTKGDFSMIDILRHVVDEIGPCRIDIGTWTAAHADVKQAHRLFEDQRIESMRWLVDRSFPNRQPKYYAGLLEKFGRDSVRIARFHAKFMVMDNADYSVAVRTSMNLNENKRIETYEISEGSRISGYLRGIVDYHFAQPSKDSWDAFKGLVFAEGDEQTPSDPEPQARLGGWD